MNKVLVLKAKPPLEGGSVIEAQLHAAHRYYNRLIELNRAFRLAADELKRQYCPGLIEAESAVFAAKEAEENLIAALRRRNAEARRKSSTAADREALQQAKRALQDAKNEQRRLRAEVRTHAGYQADLAALVNQYDGVLPSGEKIREGGLRKDARKTCGVFSGTYLRIEAAVEQATEAAAKIGNPPSFRPWQGGGLLGPQLTPPLAVNQLWAGRDSRLRLEPLPGSTRGAQRVLVWIRVQSTATRAPVWAKVPAYLSRDQLPADAHITWATLIRRQEGYRRCSDPNVPEGVWRPYYLWSVQLTLRTDTVKPRATTGSCGVNPGWWTLPDGSLRAAYVVGSDGHEEQLLVTPSLRARWQKVCDLESIRKNNFNLALSALRQQLAVCEQLPAWLTAATATMADWESPRRLSGLLHHWLTQRFHGDGAMVTDLVAWRKQDGHLEQYSLALAAKARRARRHLYWTFVAKLRQRYRRIIVNGTDYARLLRRPAVDDNDPVNETARFNARVTVPGELRQLCVQGGGSVGPSVNVTRTCHLCGSLEDWDHAVALSHTCSQCQATWDQDRNAAINLLTADSSDDAAAAPAETAAPAQGKWAKRKAARIQQAQVDQPET